MSKDYVKYDLSKDDNTLNVKKEDEKQPGVFYNSLLHDEIFKILNKKENKEIKDKTILLKDFNSNSPYYYFLLNNDLYRKNNPGDVLSEKINSRKDNLIEKVSQYLKKAKKYNIIPLLMQKLKNNLSVGDKSVKKEALEVFSKYKKIIDDTIPCSNSKINQNNKSNLFISILKYLLVIIIVIIVWLFFVLFANNINQYFPNFNFNFLNNFKKNTKQPKIKLSTIKVNLRKNSFSSINDIFQKLKSFIFTVFGNTGVISIFQLVRQSINNYSSKRIKQKKIVDIIKREVKKLEAQNKNFNLNRELIIEMSEENYLKKGEFIYKYLDEFDEFFKEDSKIEKKINNKNLYEKIFESKEMFVDILLNEQNIFLKVLFNTFFLLIIALICYILNRISNWVSSNNSERPDSSNNEISEIINSTIKYFCTEGFVYFGTKLFLSYLFADIDINITIKYIYEEIKYELNKKRNAFYLKQSEIKKENDNKEEYSNYLNGISLDEIKKIIQKYIKSDDKNYNDVYLWIKNKLVDDMNIKIIRGNNEKNNYYLVNEKKCVI